MSEGDIGYSVIKQYADLGKRIDDKGAREIAKGIFGIEDNVLEKAKIYRTSAAKLSFGFGYSVPLLTYMVRDDTYLYRIRIGYGPRKNVIVYSEKITVSKI